MSTKKLVTILVGVVLVALGIGLLSLNHYGFNIYDRPGVNIGSHGININADGSSVKIGPGGIDIKDGDDHVKVGVGGVDIKDGSDGTSVKIGPGLNIKVNDKNQFKGSIFNTQNLISENMDEEKIENLTEVKTIDVETPFVDVNIIPEDREDIKVHYIGYLEASYIPKLKTKKSGDSLYISVKKDGSNSYSVYNSDIKLNIYVPKGFKDNIKIATSSGDIKISKLELSKLNLTASSGDIDVYDLVSDSLSVETSSGEQEIKNVTSNKNNFVASSGDVEIYNFNGDANVTTSSGEIKLHYDKFDNSVNLAASSGDVEIKLPRTSQFNLDARTSSGDIQTDFPVTVSVKQKNSLSGKVGNATNSVNIVTSSGDVKIVSK